MLEGYVEIKDMKDYYINKQGEVISMKKGTPHKLKPWVCSQGHYLSYSFSINGKHIKKMVHRLVAETFIPNPNNYNIVNHIDSNTFNNCVENLEWCTQQHNLNHSYTENNQTPIRNKRKCKLIFPDGSEKEFEYCTQVQSYIKENSLDVSYHSLRYYGESKGFKLIKI